MTGSRILVCGALLLLLMGGFPARAGDPTQSRVGRIAVAEGNVAVRLAASDRPAASHRAGEWADAGLNHPIAAGMSVRSSAQGRAVLRIGAEIIALSGATEFEIVQLDHGGARITLRRGRIGVRLSQSDPAHRFDIDIPRGGVSLIAPGDYDIMAGDDNAPARLAVMNGAARFAGKGLDVAVSTAAAILLGGNDPVAALPGGTDGDDFVAWWRPAKRDAPEPALHHVSAAMTGREALDEHGNWETVDGYGAVWFPQELPDDWAPYRQGQWRWIGPWGWTWIDDMPWGFAPSHYGRWAKLGGSNADAGRWGWVPGKPEKHPAYMPAVVAFLGTAGVGLSYPDAFSPAVAWFPVAPGEVYWPDFTGDLDAIRRLNAGAVDDPETIGPALKDDPPADIVAGEYRNRRFASVVPRSVFIGGKPVAKALIELPSRRLDNAPLLAGSPQISPPTPRPAVMVSSGAGSNSVTPKRAKAAETLAKILKTRPAKKSDAKTQSAKKSDLKTRSAKKIDPKARTAKKSDIKTRQKPRASPTAAQARTDSKSLKKGSRAAAVRQASDGGG